MRRELGKLRPGPRIMFQGDFVAEYLQNAYAIFEQLHLSMNWLIAAMVIFAITFLLAVREIASWFFKVDDIKRDVRRLHGIVVSLEGEIKVLQNLLGEMVEAADPQGQHPAGASMSMQTQNQSGSAPVLTAQFPINH